MRQKAYLVGTHRYLYRAGEPAEIVGVMFVTPPGNKVRACYHILFNDGVDDFIPLPEISNFEIISEEDVKLGRIPKVVQ